MYRVRNNFRRRVNDPNSNINLRRRNRRDRIIDNAINNNNQRRIINYRRKIQPNRRQRNFVRNRVNFRRFRQSNATTKSRINSINEKVSNLVNDFEKLAIKNDTVVNKFRTKKEMRNDVLLSAMNMVKFSNKLGFFKTNLRVVKTDFYNRYNIKIATGGDAHYYFWTPYAFPNVAGVQLKKNNQVGIATGISSFYKYISDENGWLFPMDLTELKGSCRLISATLHIMNTSPVTAKQGIFTLYQLHDNNVTPYLFRADFGQTAAEMTPGNTRFLQNIIHGPIKTITNKMTFSASEEGYIDEYNTHEGTNMFGSTTEYINCSFDNPDQVPTATPCSLHYPNNSPNPIGTNISYLIEVPMGTIEQTYVVETWTVWEVAPSVSSGLGNLASLENNIFSEKVYNMACNTFPFHK